MSSTNDPRNVRQQTHTDTPVETHTVSRTVTASPAMATGDSDIVLRRDRVRWGPIAAGLVTTIGTMIVLTVLGLAVGASVLDPADSGDITTGAAIWGAVSALIAFFIGGYVAAKSAAVDGEGSAMLNGVMVGLTAITLLILMVGLGLSNLLGALGSNVNDVVDLVRSSDVTTGDASAAAESAYDDARDGAWGTLISLVLALGASALGGWAGHHQRSEILATGRTPATDRAQARV